MSEESYLNYWVILHDGTVDVGSISTIHGLDYNQCCQCEDSLLEQAGEIIEDSDIPTDAEIVNFRVNDFCWFEGQMSFPETGQWDFPPEWHFDMKITGYELQNKESVNGDT